MKRVWLFFIVGIFLIGFVSACNIDQRIMKIFSLEDSHAALWNDSGYTEDICYTDGFPAYSGIVSPEQECTGSNNVLWLHNITDSNVSFDNYEVIYSVPKGGYDCNGLAQVTLSGSSRNGVTGCRKGRSTQDLDLDLPVGLMDGDEAELVVQSNVRVRKQANCGEFVWKYNVSCVAGNLLVNGQSDRVKVDAVRGTADEGLIKIYDITTKYFRSGSSTNGYFNSIAFLTPEEPLPAPNHIINITLDGSGVTACRKGRVTGDYNYSLPIYLNDSEDSRVFIVQSNVRVRKQGNCGEFVWLFNVTRDGLGGLLVNGQSGRVEAYPKRGKVDVGFIKSHEMPPLYFNSGSSTNGFINPTSFTYRGYDVNWTEVEEIRVGFDIPLCYGNLVCELRENACNSEERLFASLHREFNSLVSKGDDSDYLYKVCCRNDLEILDRAYWANFIGDEIDNASIQDTVVLTVDHVGLYAGDIINYSIYDDGNSLLHEGGMIAVEDSYADYYWPIDLPTSYVGRRIYFAADIFNSTGLVDSLESGYLLIEPYNDTPMNITIISPTCGSDYRINDLTNIVVEASDDDDIIYGNLTIGDEVWYFSNGGISFPHSWKEAGNVQVELFAVNTRGTRKRVITSVMIIDPSEDGEYLAACIDEPSDFSDITSSNVYFRAESTRGIRYDASTGISTSIPKGQLWFSWSFSDGLVNFNHDPSLTDLAWKFNKNFVTAGHNWAVLDVEFKPGI
jgi:hypothetical protein